MACLGQTRVQNGEEKALSGFSKQEGVVFYSEGRSLIAPGTSGTAVIFPGIARFDQ
jgi:hypothetical protein